MLHKRILAVLIPLMIASCATIACGQTRPAEVTLTINDKDDHAIEAAKVTLSSGVDKDPGITALTDKQGKVKFTVPLKDDEYAGAPKSVTIKKEGLGKFTSRVDAFDAAQIEETYRLIPARTTTIHIRGPRGEPVEGVTLEFQPPEITRQQQIDHQFDLISDDVTNSGVTPVTDEQGDFRWTHASSPNSFDLSVGGSPQERLPALAVQNFTDDQDVTVTLSAQTFARVYPTRVLEGKLLLADGTPAKNWLVSQRVQRSTGGGMINGPMFDGYTTEKLSHPAADGGFVIRAPSRYLGLISPEGYEFIYVLTPQNWGGGVHRINLTVPAVWKVIRSQLVDKNGKLLAREPVRACQMKTVGFVWNLGYRKESDGRLPDSDYDTQPTMLTDENGWVNVPRYWAAESEGYEIGKLLHPKGEGLRETEYIMYDSFTPGKVTVGPNPLETMETTDVVPPQMHHVIVSFIDAAGKPIHDAPIEGFTIDNPINEYGQGNFIDTNGVHFFVKDNEKQALLTTFDEKYNRVQKEFPLDGSPRQKITITLELNKPVTGRIVDSTGKPLANIDISLDSKAPGDNSEPWKHRLDLRTTSDAAGHFVFAAAPDYCYAFVYDFNRKTDRSIFEPQDLKITPKERDFEIHMAAAKPVPKSSNSQADEDTHFKDALGKNLVPLTLLIHRDGKPFSGAEVALFTDILPPQDVLQKYESWRTATKQDEIDQAVYGLSDCAGAALDIIPTDVEDYVLQTRLTALRADLEKQNDGLKVLAMDLSDIDGKVQFSAPAGQTCVAVARVRGQLMGWKTFVVPYANPSPVDISLQPMRPLIVHTPLQNDNNRFIADPLTIEGPRVMERRCLIRAVVNDHLWGSGSIYGFPPNPDFMPFEGNDMVFPALPVGTTVTLPWDGNPQVTITPGNGPMEMTVHQVAQSQ